MYSKFVCPDLFECKIDDCLNSCRLADKLPAGRCLSVRSLGAIAEQRVWNGTPSTTQLLNGTREAYLTIVTDYTVDPQDMVYALFGTKVHAKLEEFTPDDGISEERLFDGTSSGAFDFYQDGVLYDVKTYGSFAVAKTLGLVQKNIPDGVYKTTKAGKYNKGDLKFKKVFVEGGIHKRFNLMVQLNDYRMKLERHGYKVDKMVCEILVRDGGTYIAQSRGVHQKALLVPINKISDHWVALYMKEKARRLQEALKTDTLPPPCSPRERWYDHTTKRSGKCASFCPVRYQCSVGRREMALTDFGEKVEL